MIDRGGAEAAVVEQEIPALLFANLFWASSKRRALAEAKARTAEWAQGVRAAFAALRAARAGLRQEVAQLAALQRGAVRASRGETRELETRSMAVLL